MLLRKRERQFWKMVKIQKIFWLTSSGWNLITFLTFWGGDMAKQMWVSDSGNPFDTKEEAEMDDYEEFLVSSVRGAGEGLNCTRGELKAIVHLLNSGSYRIVDVSDEPI